MKIRSKPQEYEAMEFNGLTEDVLDFIKGSDANIYIEGDYFILSNFAGNQSVNIGDVLYSSGGSLRMIHVAHRGKFDLFDKYFEVVE